LAFVKQALLKWERPERSFMDISVLLSKKVIFLQITENKHTFKATYETLKYTLQSIIITASFKYSVKTCFHIKTTLQGKKGKIFTVNYSYALQSNFCQMKKSICTYHLACNSN